MPANQSPSKGQQWFVSLLAWGLALILLGWTLRSVPWQASWQTLQGISPWKLLIWGIANAGILTLQCWRWGAIQSKMGHPIPLAPLFAYRLASFSVSYFTPGSQFGGEPWQTIALERFHDVPRPVAIASVVLDKLSELIVTFIYLALGLGLILNLGLEIPVGAIGLLIVVIVCGLTAYLAALNAGKRPFSRLHPAIAASEERMAPFTTPRALAQPILFSVAALLALLGGYGMTIWVLDAVLPAKTIIILYTVARLSQLAPTPGGLGAVEAGQLFAFVALGYDPALAISLTLLIRARDLILGLLGIGFAWKIGASTGRQATS